MPKPIKDCSDSELLGMPRPHPCSPHYPRWMRVQIIFMVRKEPGIQQRHLVERISPSSSVNQSDRAIHRYLTDLEVEGAIVRKKPPNSNRKDPWYLYPPDHEEVIHLRHKPEKNNHSARTLKVFKVPLSELSNYIPKK